MTPPGGPSRAPGRSLGPGPQRLVRSLAGGLTVLMLPLGGATVAPPAGRSPSAGRWVTAWEAPPHGSQGVYPALLPITASYPQGFAHQTLRLIITPHGAGSRLRIVLSNLYGRRTVTITAATVAVRLRGAALRAGTLRTLTFAGRGTVRIPAGRRVISDSAAIEVAPFRDLAVSLAFGPRTGPPTYHYNGLQTSWLSPTGSGDRTAATGSGAFTATTPMRFFLTEVRVLDAPRAGTVVAVGDSITDGGNYAPDSSDRDTRWPDLLQRRLLEAGSLLTVANAGISANQIDHDGQAVLAGGPSLQHRFQRDVLSQPSLAGIILLEGINDIGLSDDSASTIISGLKRIAGRAHAVGAPIVIGTLLPFEDAFDFSAARERIRAQVNAWIRRQHVFDGVVDFAAAVRDASDPRRLRPAYDSGDHLHPNARGFLAMARAVPLRLLSRLFGRKGTR